MSHATYSPSRLVCLEHCAGFLGGLPSEAASRGTEINEIIDVVLAGEFIDIDPEFQPLVEYALERVEEAKAWCGEPCEVLTQVSLKGQIPETDGTADLVVVNEFEGRLVLIDWKTGYSERAHAAEHIQLMTYGSAAAARWNVSTIRLQLVELDRRRFSECISDAAELVNRTLPRVNAIIKRAQTSTEEDWQPNHACKWCVRHVTCPAIRKTAIVPAGEISAITTEDPEAFAANLTAQDCGAFLTEWTDRIEMAYSIFKHIKGRATSILKAGGQVDGWQLGNGRKNRRWIDENEARFVLESHLGPDVLETSLRSPAAIEEKFGKKAVKDILSQLVKVEPVEKLVRIEKEA